MLDDKILTKSASSQDVFQATDYALEKRGQEMNEIPDINDLKCALIDFKSLVGTPPEVGDEEAWCQQLNSAFTRLENSVQTRKNHVHEKWFAEIANQDSSRKEQISQFKKTDEEIKTTFELVHTHLVVVSLPKSELQEDKLSDQIIDLSEHAVSLIHRIEEQERSVAEWVSEIVER